MPGSDTPHPTEIKLHQGSRILDEQDQVIDCYAGWVSAQIYADGTVWPCCVRADDLGNLRDHNYDFKKIWFGEKIREVRRSVAARECHCPLANASYTNMLHDFPTLTRVGVKLLRPNQTEPARRTGSGRGRCGYRTTPRAADSGWCGRPIRPRPAGRRRACRRRRSPRTCRRRGRAPPGDLPLRGSSFPGRAGPRPCIRGRSH